MISRKKQKLLLGLVAVLIYAIFGPQKFAELTKLAIAPTIDISPPNQDSKSNFSKVKVARVVDGDTIEVIDATGTLKKLRYIGINTPETVDPRRSVQCFGHEASSHNKELIEGKEVYLEKDVSETDKYGRLLRYVYLSPDEPSINEQLVRDGYAYASAYPPDIKYQNKLKEAEDLARSEQKGLWQACPLKP